MCHKKEGFSIDLRAVKKWNSRHAVMGSQSVLPGIFRLAMSGRSMSRIPTMGGLRPPAGVSCASTGARASKCHAR